MLVPIRTGVPQWGGGINANVTVPFGKGSPSAPVYRKHARKLSDSGPQTRELGIRPKILAVPTVVFQGLNARVIKSEFG